MVVCELTEFNDLSKITKGVNLSSWRSNRCTDDNQVEKYNFGLKFQINKPIDYSDLKLSYN